MLTEEFVKSINGTEIMFQPVWSPCPINTILLAKIDVGVSFKPLWIDDEEEAYAIKNRAEYYEDSIQDTIEIMNAPTYCFSFAQPTIEESFLLNIIQSGKSPDGIFNTPVCQFV